MNLDNDNVISKANESKFKSNISEYKSELAIAKSSSYLNDSKFKSSTLVAVPWDGTDAHITGTIKEYVKSITVEDGANFAIQNGKLVYVGLDTVQQDWSRELGFEVLAGTVEIVASTTSLTNGDVTVTINYPAELVTIQYSANGGSTWLTYSGMAITITDNNTTILAKGLDAGGNSSPQVSLIVTNIDKVAPTVSYGTNGASYVQPASTTVTVNDANGINASTLQYVWDTQNSSTPSSGWTTFTNGTTITKTTSGTYYLWIKANDNAGNSVTSKTNAFTISGGPASPY